MDSIAGMKSTFLSIFLVFTWVAVVSAAPSFTVDFTQHSFIKDGKPFRYIAGSYHYSRVPSYYWQDRLKKAYAAGLDAIQIYVPWNVHEPQPGVYDFAGQQDLMHFLELAKQENLLVILRAGPYICGEWEFGGFPWWLLKMNSSMVLRTMDAGYIKYVDRWMGVLLPKIKPMLYSQGGNVIMVQVENEYGSYFACDHDYMGHLRNLFLSYLGHEVILFTTDGNVAHDIQCGTADGLLTTIDFGPGGLVTPYGIKNFDNIGSGNITKAFQPLVDYQPDGPLVNSEYYTGWLDYWGHTHAHTATAAVTKTLQDMLDAGANVNMYMFEGGTNFGFWNGADPPYMICPTSYDYDAPLSEAGDITDKYMAIRELIGKYKTLPTVPIPPNTPKLHLGNISMTSMGSVHDLLPQLKISHLKTNSKYPLTQEQVGQDYGFLLYTTVLKHDSSGLVLNCTGVQDMGYILVDGQFYGLVDRNGVTVLNLIASAGQELTILVENNGRLNHGDTISQNTKDFQGVVDRNAVTQLNLIASQGQELSILVENHGRVNYGNSISTNTKGIISNITLGTDILTDWQIYPLNFTKAFDMINENHAPAVTSAMNGPTVYKGTFTLPSDVKTMHDTYLDPTGWFKGQAYINGFNLGRYWPSLGPQVTLYVPGGPLKFAPEVNTVVMVELQHSPCPNGCAIAMTDVPYINKTIHSGNEVASTLEDDDSTLYFKPRF